ncbi:MAG: tetratricopeptide repeat protein [Bacteroidota bacterium]|nr:tetratricopeptide repeat protein [Bacteroidota bacterium]
MKKIILSLFLVISFTLSFAQKANISKAKNKALMENPDFTGAREAIKLALKDSTTKNLAETWYVAGLIGNKENEAQYQKALLKMPFDTITKGKALMESYDYFIQALKLDQVPDAKGKVKPKYSKDIKSMLKDYYSIQQNLIAYGAFQFEKKNYEGAVKTFEAYLAIPKLPVMNNEIKTDSTYNMISYYTAVSSANANMHDKAISIYEGLKDKKYETKSVYQSLYEEYVAKKDTANFVNTLKEGLDIFPKEAWFLQNLINYYIYSGKTKDALVYLDKAIDREPALPQYRYVKGNLEESLGNYDEARAAFDKAIELDPTQAESYAGIGRIYYNKAVKILEASSKIKDMKLYNVEAKKAEDLFKQSLPFFKKASEVNPKEIEYKKTLKTLYYRLQMNAEFDAIKKEIDAM